MMTRCGSIIADVELEVEQRNGEDSESAGPSSSADLRADIASIVNDPEIIVREMPTVTDINECEDPTLNNCSINSICTNTDGSYFCTCKQDYQVDLSENRDELGRVCAKPCPADHCREVERCEVQPESEPLCLCKDGEFCGIWMWALMGGVLGGIVLIIIIGIIIGSVCSRRKQEKISKRGADNSAYYES
ncbi:63 kDa sperm flagellar membrane protein-like [Watersipora subatra]|uniref:63 kDa sperm flagellar membrane protein-like n=1 Tax=Watersipora subatra TaxID=2589382 RepID=UPI00355C297A